MARFSLSLGEEKKGRGKNVSYHREKEEERETISFLPDPLKRKQKRKHYLRQRKARSAPSSVERKGEDNRTFGRQGLRSIKNRPVKGHISEKKRKTLPLKLVGENFNLYSEGQSSKKARTLLNMREGRRKILFQASSLSSREGREKKVGRKRGPSPTPIRGKEGEELKPFSRRDTRGKGRRLSFLMSRN